jgi:hypothetical protein
MRAEKTGKTARAIRVIFFSVLITVVALALVIAGFWLTKRQARVRWKDLTLSRLATAYMTNELIHGELEQLQAEPTRSANRRWAHDHVLLMTNGDYIVYGFWHGANSGFVDHLFLGRASNGLWLYSTYHFCNSMAGILGDDPPGTIAEFEKSYSVREFDGQSDVCLQHTWP